MHGHGTLSEGKIRSPHLDTVSCFHVNTGISVSRDGGGGTFEADSQGSEFAFDGVVGVFGAKVVIYNGPASDGPAVVHLPYQGPGAVFSTGPFPLALPESVSAGQTFRLHELGAVDEVFDRVKFVLHVLDEV